MNFLTQAVTYLLIVNLVMPGAGCQCLSDEDGAMSHSSGPMSMHESTHAEHTISHHAQKQAQVSDQALDSAQTHTCLEETCSKNNNAISQVVAQGHNALLITWHEGEQTEGKYTAHMVALDLSDIARAPPAFTPPDILKSTTFESPLTRFDRLII